VCSSDLTGAPERAARRDAHGLAADPRLVDDGTDDYRLRPGSPSMDSGDPASCPSEKVPVFSSSRLPVLCSRFLPLWEVV